MPGDDRRSEEPQPEASPPSSPAKVERPRDRFGRPLAAGSTNRLDLPDFDALSIEDNHRLAIEFFNDAIYFGAHEAWETAWRAAHGTPDEAFFKALAQLGAGYTHYQRNNPHGARALLTRAAAGLATYASPHRGLDIGRLVAAIEADIARIGARGRDDGVPPLEPPQI
ncbi:MAG: DUF309 domain-containing protein [Dehalococcoidia bacterium]|nr:DUF309 domain-containing protein [Dehalococcoidia bacterium]